ncbi:MAG: cellulase family glycosylhydrolase [Armatimonadota bacterium]
MLANGSSCHIDESGIAQPPISDNSVLQIGEPVTNDSIIPMYGKFEVSFALQGTYSNAFDPDQISVTGAFQIPNGKVIEQPAFYFQSYTRKLDSNTEVFQKDGSTIWKIRFSPTIAGTYALIIKATDSTMKTVNTTPIRFTCVKSDLPGFIGISTNDNRYFTFSNGEVYFPIGANLCWGSSKGTFDYDYYLSKFGAAGCNYFRIFLGPGWVTTGLEKTGIPADRYGAGKIDLVNAWRLDYILDLAAKNNQYVMLCIDASLSLRKRIDSFSYWEESPMNAANGGPISEPGDFWTNLEMQRLYRNKLRYLAARYGWSTNVMSWEFWNEVDFLAPSVLKPDEIAQWHTWMGDYLRKIDNWKHLRTTSFANSAGMKDIISLPQMDLVQTHNYGSRDTSTELSNWQLRNEKYRKPFFFGEFGADSAGSDATVDRTGIAIHNGLWASVMSGGSGTAMPWYWDNHIEANNLYYHFSAISRFLKDIDFDMEDFRHISNASFTYGKNPPSDRYKELMFQGPVSWNPSKANKPTTIKINGDGKVQITGEVSGILHGVVGHRNEHNPLTFATNLPHPAQLKISVSGASGLGGGHLVVALDGNTVFDKDMPDNDDKTLDTLHQYDGTYEVVIPAGKHRLVVDNTGADWILIGYLLKNAIKQNTPDLTLYGLKGKTTSIIWVSNTQNQWYRVGVMKLPVEEQKNALLIIPGWSDGEYLVKFWDTYTGKIVNLKSITVDEGRLSIGLPTISKDIALSITSLNSIE